MKILKLLLWAAFCPLLAQAQVDYSLIENPYRDFVGEPEPAGWSPVMGGYNGEYQIIPSFIWPYTQMSYKIEVVSFPFTPPCWYDEEGCTDESTTTRVLKMPDGSYSVPNKWWDGELRREVEDVFGYGVHKMSHETTLSSASFVTGGPIDPAAHILPHTVHKITLRYHCDDPLEDEVIDEVSFIYDNTRGRMKFYPFRNSNTHSNDVEDYDVVFTPTLAYDQDELSGFPHDYGENTINNAAWYDGNGTINYYPSNEVDPEDCSNGMYPTGEDLDYPFMPHVSPFIYESGFIHPAPYTLMVGTLRNHLIEGYAGYTVDGSGDLQYSGGIEQTYEIDQNINLNIINSLERVIYNPSEVNVTASDLEFPCGYVFKTVRGRYPTVDDVNDYANLEGEPYYGDLRNVVVPTDLDGTPQRASKYNLKSGSKLTINDGVGIYDATFYVESGAELEVDLEQVYGRFDIIDDGGELNGSTGFGNKSIVRGALHDNTIGYTLENNAIDKNILYEAINIEAGYDVGAPTTNGDLTIESGAEVIFNAVSHVYLEPGFHAKAGSYFHAFIDGLVGCAEPNIFRDYKKEEVAQEDSKPANAAVRIYPNPNNGQFILTFPYTEVKAQIALFNLLGEQVYSSTVTGSSQQLELSTLPKGVYTLEFINGNELYTEKIIIQ